MTAPSAPRTASSAFNYEVGKYIREQASRRALTSGNLGVLAKLLGPDLRPDIQAP